MVNTHYADQMCQTGITQKDDSIKPTGHIQVEVRLDQRLFRVRDRSGKNQTKITVDEGMADLLMAIWKHRIPTTKSCQGGHRYQGGH